MDLRMVILILGVLIAVMANESRDGFGADRSFNTALTREFHSGGTGAETAMARFSPLDVPLFGGQVREVGGAKFVRVAP